MVVHDALKDERFRANPLVTGDPKRALGRRRAFVDEGRARAWNFVRDRSRSARFYGKQLEALKILSRLVVTELELRRNVNDLSTAMLERQRIESEVDQLFDLSLELLALRDSTGISSA